MIAAGFRVSQTAIGVNQKRGERLTFFGHLSTLDRVEILQGKSENGGGFLMFGECHAHVIMDGKNYKAAVAIHKEKPDEGAIREHLEAWQQAGITFVRDGGDAYGVSERARELAGEYGIDYRSPIFAIHKRGHYGGIVGLPYDDHQGYRDLVKTAKLRGADFIKIMISGIMEFDTFGKLTEEGLEADEIAYLIGTAHDAGLRVMAHGNGDAVAHAALNAGVDTLEHGNYMEEETLCQLAESETIWVPTFAPIGNLIGCGRFPDGQVKAILARQQEAVQFAFTRGARIGLGSDSGAYLVSHGQGLMDEYAFMKEAVGRKYVEELDRRLTESEAWIRKEMKAGKV